MKEYKKTLFLFAFLAAVPIAAKADGYEGSPLERHGDDSAALEGEASTSKRSPEVALPSRNSESLPPTVKGQMSKRRQPLIGAGAIAGDNDNSAANVLTESQSRTSAKSVSAFAHYSRSRALLLAAIREFDQGLRFVNTEPVIDPRAWRREVGALAQRLDKVLSPQAKVSSGGVKLEASPSLLSETNN